MTNHLDDECQKCKVKENKTNLHEEFEEEDFQIK